MGVDVTYAVWEYSKASANDLHVLLILADAADNETRLAWPGVARMAKRARVDERTVQRCLKRLAEEPLREIEVVRPGGRYTENGVTKYRSTVYRVLTGKREMEGRQSVTPQPDQGVTKKPQGVTPVPGEPSLEPSVGSVVGGALVSSQLTDWTPRFAEIDDKTVTQAEDALAIAVLAAFNAIFPTARGYLAREHYRGIVMRARDRPDLRLTDFVDAIKNAKAGNPWWRQARGSRKGTQNPTPRHIFGTGAAFENALNSTPVEEPDAPQTDIFDQYD